MGAYIFHFLEYGLSEVEFKEYFAWLCVSVCLSGCVSLVAVIVVFVVTAEGCETPQTDPIREKYLGPCIHPYLQRESQRESTISA